MKTISQTIVFKTSPHVLYEIFMDSDKHAVVTGAEANISRKVGDKFSCHGGWVHGENVELVKDEKIVQKWRGKDWPKGHYSLLTIEFLDLKEKKNEKCKVKLTHKEVPDKYADMIDKGWHEHYWNKIKKFLGE